MDVQERDAECWRAFVLVMVGHVDPDQQARAPHLLQVAPGGNHLVGVTGGELHYQPPLPPRLPRWGQVLTPLFGEHKYEGRPWHWLENKDLETSQYFFIFFY